MMASSSEDEDEIGGINITPLVDVSLVLVLIFMVAMPLSVLHGIDVKRQALQRYGLSTPQENVTVRLTTEGVFIADSRGQDRAVAYQDIGMVLSQMLRISSGKQVFLDVERQVPHGQAVWVMDMAKQNGAADVSLLQTE